MCRRRMSGIRSGSVIACSLQPLEPRRHLSAGDLDLSFSGDGINSIDLPGVSGETANAAVVLADGKTVLAGRATVGGELDFFVARVLANGNIDTTFGGGDGFVTIDFQVNDEAMDLAIDSTNRIVVVGTSSSGAGSNARDFAIARLTSSGALDGTFSGDGKTTVDFGSNDDAQALEIDASGRIYVGGYKDIGSSGQFALVRLLTTGAQDSSYSGDGEVFFGFGSGGDSRAYDIALDSTGRVFMVGYDEATGTSTGRNFAYAVVGTNALLDPSFSGDGLAVTDFGGGSDDEARSVAIDSFGRVVVGGFTDGTGGDDFAATRITSTGSLDSSFNGDGRFTVNLGGVEQVDSLALQPDGDVTLAGMTSFGAFQAALVRVSGNSGNLSTTFGDGGDGIQLIDFGGVDDGFAVALDPRDFRAVVAGTDGGGRLAVGRVHDLIDQNFQSAQSGSRIIELADGELLVFNTSSLRRLLPNGALNLQFGGGDGTITRPVADTQWSDFAVDSLGRIVIVGARDNSGGGRDFLVRRYTADGLADNSFSADGVTTFRFDIAADFDFASAVAIDPQNRVVVGGGAEEGIAPGVIAGSDFAIARLTEAGALDSTFSGDGLQNVDLSTSAINGTDSISDLIIQPDGKIVAGGESHGFKGIDRDWAFLRLDPDGSQDNGFGFLGEARINVGGNEDFMTRMALDASNRIVAVGSEDRNEAGGESSAVIIRLTPAGSLDSSFASDGMRKFETGDEEAFTDVAIQPDGRIIALQNSGNPLTGNLVRRLLATGSDDVSFGSDGVYSTPIGPGFSGVATRGGAIFLVGSKTMRLNVNPGVVDFEFRFETFPQNIRGGFNDHIGDSLADSDLFIRNVTTNSTVGINAYDTEPYDALNNRSTASFLSILADGNYTATYNSTFIENNQNMNLAGNRVREFFFLNADGNRDRSVNLDDFTILAANFGQTGRVFSQGNFDYTLDGAVSLDDFTLLAAQFGKTLPAPADLPRADAARATGARAPTDTKMGAMHNMGRLFATRAVSSWRDLLSDAGEDLI